ncbi:MAG: hypothetical protein RL308_2631 [Bacteroidota bacterium]|jgi:hypothetical protein
MKIKGLSIIALISLLVVVWINFINFKLETYLDGVKIENLIENLCMSYIAGYIFFFLNSYLIERDEKKHIMPFIARNVIGMIVNNYSIINCFKGNMNMKLNDYPNLEEFKILLANVNPKDKVPFFFKNQNWFFLLDNRKKSTILSIDRILISGKYVDEELRAIVLKMSNSLYLKDDYAFNSDEFEKQNLSDYSIVFFDYFALINQLNKYYVRHLKKYYDSRRI